MKKYKIAYIVSDLSRVGPTNQTLNIINNSKYKEVSVVITLFNEKNDSMIEEYKNNNIEVICLNINRQLFFINGKKKIIKVLKELEVSLVHSYGIKPDFLCQKACKRLKMTHILTLRNYPKEDILTRMNTVAGFLSLRLHLHALMNSQHIICCSKTIYNKMKTDYPTLNISYIQNGVDIEKYTNVTDNEKKKLRKKLSILQKEKIFISTGSFIPRKRIEETISLFLNIPEENKKLILLGNGELFDSIRLKYSTYDNILFLGKQSNINEWLQASDYFISSSESEGLPNGVIEAIATSVPTILSDIPQHLEILDAVGEVGIIYTLGNINEIQKKYKKIDSNEYKEMKSNCQNIKNSNLNMKNMSNNYCYYYEKTGCIK